MEKVFIASLGESPIVVTAMFDLLQQEVTEPIDHVEVLVPQGELIPAGYDLIKQGIQEYCKEHNIPLPQIDDIPLLFEDAKGEDASYDFLRELAKLFSKHKHDTVYLSLAGGRKNMSALMAMLTPLYPCVKKLYHIHDKDEHTPQHHFLSIEALYDLPESKRKSLLFPNHEKVTLVSIPYGEKQHASQQFMSRLVHLTDDQLDDVWDSDPEEAENLEALRPIYQNSTMGRIIPLSAIRITPNAAAKYRKLRQGNAQRARGFSTCFKQMRYVPRLINGAHQVYPYKGKGQSLEFHFYKRTRTVERPFFFTEPQDVCVNPDAKVEHLVITELEIEVNGEYRQGPEILKSLKFPLETLSFEKEFPQDDIPEVSILLIPLGTSPMVATQLYTLLKEGRTIRKVILIHPKHRFVIESAKLVESAFKSREVTCESKVLADFEDIDSRKACEAYQTFIEKIIDDVTKAYPECQLEVAISGGRKGMAALTMFAAQRKGIRFVYHTLIADDELNDRIDKEMSLDELRKMHRINKQNCYNHLFLDAYANDKDKFIVFKVPVVPTPKG